MVEIIYILAKDPKFYVVREEENRHLFIARRSRNGELDPIATVDVRGKSVEFHGPYRDAGRDIKEIETLIEGLERDGYSHDLDAPKPERSCRGDGPLCD